MASKKGVNPEEKFEIDELAARTHTPPDWPIHTIEINPRGKAPKKYGVSAYRFGAALTLSVILPRRGWTLIKTARNYAYLVSPADQPSPPFYISIAIPTQAECLELARRSYARGQSWMGQLGEWPAWYLHKRNTDMQQIWRDPVTGLMQTRLHANPLVSSLSIGQAGCWYAEVEDRTGEFVVQGYQQPWLSVGSEGADVVMSELFEGAPKQLDLTSYERNPTARRLCIQHYGARCQACGLSYEDKYGPIGADMIHVHHVTPLSAVGEAYRIDPVRDLIPLCANCHHVVHRRNPPYTVAEIKSAIEARTDIQCGPQL